MFFFNKFLANHLTDLKLLLPPPNPNSRFVFFFFHDFRSEIAKVRAKSKSENCKICAESIVKSKFGANCPRARFHISYVGQEFLAFFVGRKNQKKSFGFNFGDIAPICLEQYRSSHKYMVTYRKSVFLCV